MLSSYIRIRRSAYLDSAASQEETDLLGARVATCQRYLNRHWHDTGLQAAIKGAHEADRVVVRVNEGDSVTGFQATIPTAT